MADKYEIDFKQFDVTKDLAHYDDAAAVKAAEDMIASGKSNYRMPTITDLVNRYNKYKNLSDSQRSYLLGLIYQHLPEYNAYQQNFNNWYDSRDDIQEIYKYGMKLNPYAYVHHPLTGEYVGRGTALWDKSWDDRPGDARMFWRMTNDWTVRKFVEVNRESDFEEGDLVVLRKGQVGNWRYDPYYDGNNTPNKLTDRIGTVMQMTDDVHRRSRAGRGSRVINVLWIGQSEMKGVPERILKLHERKPRKKKA